MKITTNSPEETMELGKQLGQLLPSGMVICLQGNLGAGKTHFTKGVALGLDITDRVTSPTFTIINEYIGRLPLYHIDAYRLDNVEEVQGIGFEDYLFGDGVSIVEWPERLNGFLPEEYITITIDYAEDYINRRDFNFHGLGDKSLAVIEELKRVVHTGN